MAAQVFSSEGVFFVKWNSFGLSEDQVLFEAEAKGLDLLRQADALQIPQVIDYGRYGDKAYLILEYIEPGKPTKTYWQTLGQSLAVLHSHTQLPLAYTSTILLALWPRRTR